MTRRLAGLALLIVMVAVAWAWNATGGVSPEAAGAARDALLAWHRTHPAQAALAYFASYVAVATLSLPGAALLTLVGGAVFGLAWGTVLVSFAASLGALFAFLIARYLLGDTVRRRFARQLAGVDAGMRRDGVRYLLTLRLVPVFPFFLVNLLMALTPLRAAPYYLASQVGMLPGTLVYVNAGTQLAQVRSPSDLLTPGLLASLALLGALPWVAKRLLPSGDAGTRRPARFDRDLVVIGAGAAGLVAANVAAALEGKVTLVERAEMGGDCLNTGCVPSKALIRAAHAAHAVRHAQHLGIRAEPPRVDFPAVMAGVRRAVAAIAPHDSVARYRALGVEVLQARASLRSPWEVEIAHPDGRSERVTARAVVIATGARPRLPDLPGLDAVAPLTSETVWSLDALPARLLVLGGGAVGCELAQAFARLGSTVMLVERGEALLGGEDAAASARVRRALEDDGVQVLTGRRAMRCEGTPHAGRLQLAQASGETDWLAFDRLLCAVGRAPDTQGLGLEALGIEPDARGRIPVDAHQRTRHPSVLAVGDAASPAQLTHVAGHLGAVAAVNGLLGRLGRGRRALEVLPRCVFTDPEVARVGLTEAQARERGLAVRVMHLEMKDLDRAVTEDATSGFARWVVDARRGTLLGATVVAPRAGEIVAPVALAMRNRLGPGAFLRTLHAYPTWSEANHRLAAQWQRARMPAWAPPWLARLHAWRRG